MAAKMRSGKALRGSVKSSPLRKRVGGEGEYPQARVCSDSKQEHPWLPLNNNQREANWRQINRNRVYRNQSTHLARPSNFNSGESEGIEFVPNIAHTNSTTPSVTIIVVASSTTDIHSAGLGLAGGATESKSEYEHYSCNRLTICAYKTQKMSPKAKSQQGGSQEQTAVIRKGGFSSNW